MSEFKDVQQVFADLYNDCSSRATATAVTKLQKIMSKEEMAEMLVDAFNRGWITNFNLGLNQDGEPI